jgi:transposase-like protein
MDCPKCKIGDYVKDGKLRGLQRYKCKRCLYRYTVERKSDVKTKETRRLALEMYLEGLGFRSIGRILKISYGTVYVWVNEWGSKVSLPRREDPARIVELDEMHTYVGKKTTVGYGLLLIDLEKNTSILSVATAPQKPAENCGERLSQ